MTCCRSVRCWKEQHEGHHDRGRSKYRLGRAAEALAYSRVTCPGCEHGPRGPGGSIKHAHWVQFHVVVGNLIILFDMLMARIVKHGNLPITSLSYFVVPHVIEYPATLSFAKSRRPLPVPSTLIIVYKGHRENETSTVPKFLPNFRLVLSLICPLI